MVDFGSPQRREGVALPSSRALGAPSEDLAPSAPSINEGQCPDTWPYLLDKLGSMDEAWDQLSIGALVKISKESSVLAVSYALTLARLTPPVLHRSAYAWVRAVARTFEEAGVE